MSGEQITIAESNEAVVELLRAQMQAGDYVLVKGSRGAAMEGISGGAPKWKNVTRCRHHRDGEEMNSWAIFWKRCSYAICHAPCCWRPLPLC